MENELYERACKMIGRQALEIERHWNSRVELATALRDVADEYERAGNKAKADELHAIIARHGL